METRVVQLRRRPGDPFGFSLRGGREHGTGFFVSAVEPGSEAHRNNLRVGDQVIRVNGFPVEDAIHSEVLYLIQNQLQLNLKVRTVGMLPVKEKNTDPITWQFINDQSMNSDLRKLIPSSLHNEKMSKEVRLIINVASSTKLGCGICKGPEWHPGIFVQFTKENGIARSVGLAPGDQILECNGVKFADISFSNAVSVLKSSKKLDLIVRKNAGLDLFPGESSGYNSSASSVNGDQSPNWEDMKRLSVVKEESNDADDRLSHPDQRQNSLMSAREKSWNDIGYEWKKSPSTKPKTWSNVRHTCIRSSGTCTIIHVGDGDGSSESEQCSACLNNIETDHQTDSDSGTEASDIHTRVQSGSSKIADICMITKQQETKTVVVEVHRSEGQNDCDNVQNEEHDCSDKRPQLVKSASSNSFASATSNCSQSSLSSAISEELKRRSERQALRGVIPDRIIEPRKPSQACLNDEKQLQHKKLMEEFKKAHHKMFLQESKNSAKNSVLSEGTCDYNKDRGPIQIRGLQMDKTSINNPIETSSNKTTQLVSPGFKGIYQPPPAPPLPRGGNNSLSSSRCSRSQGSFVYEAIHDIPHCPTPDYDSTSVSTVSSLSSRSLQEDVLSKHSQKFPNKLSSITNKSEDSSGKVVNSQIRSAVPTASNSSPLKNEAVGREHQKGVEKVEMESLESFKLNSPKVPTPKPPPLYFNTQKQKANSSYSSTSSNETARRHTVTGFAEKPKGVNITIREYPSGSERRNPSRFDFLSANQTNGSTSNDEPITSKLQSELQQTLSRSNIKKKVDQETEVQQTGWSTKHTEAATKGTVTISINSAPPPATAITKHRMSLPNVVHLSSQNNTVNKVPLFDSASTKSNIKPSIRNAVEKLNQTFSKNKVTIQISNPSNEINNNSTNSESKANQR